MFIFNDFFPVFGDFVLLLYFFDK